MYALVDCHSFFASCEQLFRPDLKGKPVVVLSNNDGCIVARSKEAKALGIPMAVPMFKVRDFMQQNNVVAFSSNYSFYQDISNRVMQVLERIVPKLEVYSIDEAFADLSGLSIEQIRVLAQQLYSKPHRGVGIPVGVGIAPTKTLAKLANVIAKSMPLSICILHTEAQRLAALEQTPVEKVWGIGRRTAQHLHDIDIHTALELANMPQTVLRQRFNVQIARTAMELNGIVCFADEDNPDSHQKQIISSRMFGKKQTQKEPIAEAVAQYSANVCERLRKKGLYAGCLSVFVTTGKYADNMYRNSAMMQFESATNNTAQCIQAAKKLLDELYKPNYYYKKAGVVLFDLCSQQNYQLSLFEDPADHEKSERLMQMLDRVNHKEHKLFYAAQGINQSWQHQRQLKSPSYTTRWQDLPVV